MYKGKDILPSQVPKMYLMAMVLNGIIFNMSLLYYIFHVNIHTMVIFFLNSFVGKLT
jgi:hypothetical protein